MLVFSRDGSYVTVKHEMKGVNTRVSEIMDGVNDMLRFCFVILIILKSLWIKSYAQMNVFVVLSSFSDSSYFSSCVVSYSPSTILHPYRSVLHSQNLSLVRTTFGTTALLLVFYASINKQSVISRHCLGKLPVLLTPQPWTPRKAAITTFFTIWYDLDGDRTYDLLTLYLYTIDEVLHHCRWQICVFETK